MRPCVVAAVLAAFALLVPSAPAAPPFKATLKAPTHTPKTNVKWFYEVRVTDLAGKPIRAKVTMQVVDTFGGVHPVEFGPTTQQIVNHPFTGVFRDYAIWPLESAGFKLTFRAIVTAKGATTTVSYWVRPR